MNDLPMLTPQSFGGLPPSMERLPHAPPVYEQLQGYYGRELSYVRRMLSQYAAQQPSAARRLMIGEDGQTKDPHVERMIEAFALMTASVHRKLDDDFPEIVDAVLGILYPHYQAPVPSMAITQFSLHRSRADAIAGQLVPADTAVETDPALGDVCRFRTRYPVMLYPLEITTASLDRLPLPVSGQPRPPMGATAMLRLQLRGFAPDLTVSKIRFAPAATETRFGAPSSPGLRMFIRAEPQYALPLYELLLNHLVDVTLTNGPMDPRPFPLGNQCLRPVGFASDEGLLPYSARSFMAYRLVTEYFALPEKFLFFDLTGLTPEAVSRLGNTVDVCFYFNRSVAELERNVDASTIRLGCTPIVNLFKKTADPVRLTHTQTQYRVVPDARTPRAHEVYSVDRVVAVSPDGAQSEYRPFYSFRHACRQGNQKTFWYSARKPASEIAFEAGQGHIVDDPATEVYLTPVDLDLRPSVAANLTLDLQTTCMNRDLPARLPFGPGQPRLQLPRGGAISVDCITKPTPALRPSMGKGLAWRLVSHLALNHVSLVDGHEGAASLAEVLHLYDFAGTMQTRAQIDGITEVHSRHVAGRVGNGITGGFCRGIEVTIALDERHFPGGSTYLFASLLERFLAAYCSINSFSLLVARTVQQESVLKRWEPRCGEQLLL